MPGLTRRAARRTASTVRKVARNPRQMWAPRRQVFPAGGRSATTTTTTTTNGEFVCRVGVGVVAPTVTALFTHRQCYYWMLDVLKEELNDIAGFDLSSDPTAGWNTADPSNSYVSVDIERTIGEGEEAVTDIYVLTVVEHAVYGWLANISIKEGAEPNCDDQLDWTLICATPHAPRPFMANEMVLFDPQTKTSEDGAYINPPRCSMNLVPKLSVLECEGYTAPKDWRADFDMADWFTGDAGHFQAPDADSFPSYNVSNILSDHVFSVPCCEVNINVVRPIFGCAVFSYPSYPGGSSVGARTSGAGWLWGHVTPPTEDDPELWMMSLDIEIVLIAGAPGFVNATAECFARFGAWWNHGFSGESLDFRQEYRTTHSIGSYSTAGGTSDVAARKLATVNTWFDALTSLTLARQQAPNSRMDFPAEITFTRV